MYSSFNIIYTDIYIKKCQMHYIDAAELQYIMMYTALLI